MSEYAFTPGMEVYVEPTYGIGVGALDRVEKISRGFAVVSGTNYRMDGSPVTRERFGGSRNIRPATDADRDAIRRSALAYRVAKYPPAAFARLPADRLASILADLEAANPARTP